MNKNFRPDIDPCEEWGCEQFHSPYCPVGTAKRREANHRAELVQYAFSRGIAVAVLDRQRAACERGDGSCNHRSISDCVELARVYNVAAR